MGKKKRKKKNNNWEEIYPQSFTAPRRAAGRVTVSKEVIRGVAPRGCFEHWLDRHNHEMEFLRTLFGLATISLQVLILVKIFNFI